VNHHYNDIRSRIAEEPLWFDEHAVPRYNPFSPNETANIYGDESCLLLIECQACSHEFQVCLSRGSFMSDVPSLASLVESQQIHYGDPPNGGCCAAGPTMNSVPRRVLEFWRKSDDYLDWIRVPELEITVHAAWDTGDDA
jgi:hypothetical protein